MRCRVCNPFWKWAWEKSDAWERSHSNESYLWSSETEQNRELIEQAEKIEKTDPGGSFGLCVEAAEGGSAWAMRKVGWHYQTGTLVAADTDKAVEYYRRAICAGSWMATIEYAQLLADKAHHDHGERVLKDGIASDFVPAYFWLARLRYHRSKTRKIAWEIRPLLEYAAWRGHPMAQIMLAQLMTSGKFGAREIFAGLKASLRFGRSAANDPAGPSLTPNAL